MGLTAKSTGLCEMCIRDIFHTWPHFLFINLSPDGLHAGFERVNQRVYLRLGGIMAKAYANGRVNAVIL